jgi:large subunit ribosomal protein L30
MSDEKKLRVTLVRGLTGKKPGHRDTVRGLGLRWRNDTVVLSDTPQTRGMIGKVSYMVKVSEAQG